MAFDTQKVVEFVKTTDCKYFPLFMLQGWQQRRGNIFILACGGTVQWSLGSIGIWLLRKLGICYNIMDNRYKSIYD